MALSDYLLCFWYCFARTWGSTGKEVERSTFWIEGRHSTGRKGGFLFSDVVMVLFLVPRIWKRFKLSFIICFLAIAMMVVFTTDLIPLEWQIPGWNWALIIPLSLVVGCHILLPVSSDYSVFFLGMDDWYSLFLFFPPRLFWILGWWFSSIDWYTLVCTHTLINFILLQWTWYPLKFFHSTHRTFFCIHWTFVYILRYIFFCLWALGYLFFLYIYTDIHDFF